MIERIKEKNIHYLLYPQLLLMFFSFLPSFFCNVNFIDSLKFYVFFLFVITIPGFALTVKNNKCETVFEYYSYSLFFGLSVLIVEYLVLMLLHLSKLSFIVSAVISLLSIYYLLKNYEYLKIEKEDRMINYAFYVLLIALYFFCFVAVSYGNPTPDILGETQYDQDFLFWVGNSVALSKKFPPYDFRMVGNYFFYHFFSSIVVAQTYINTGIDIPVISYCFSHLISLLWMISSAFCLFKKTIVKKWLIAVGVFLLFFTEGSTVFHFHHLFVVSFGYDYGFACGLLAIADLISMEETDDYSIKRIVISCLMIVLCTGFKGPIGIVVLMMHGVEAFMMLFMDFKKGTIYGLSWLISFLFTYFVFISNPFNKVRTINGLEFVGPFVAFERNYWAMNILTNLIDSGLPNNGITRIIALFLFVYRSNKIAILSLMFACIFLLICLIKKIQIRRYFVGLIMIMIWGLVLGVSTHQNGYSQFYFMMAAFPYGVLSGMYVIDHVNNTKVATALFVIVLLLGSSDIVLAANTRFYKTISKTLKTRNVIDRSSSYPSVMNDKEYDIAKWLKNNTEEDDYIALDTFVVDGYRKEEMLGVFSQRYVYNDGHYSDDIEQAYRRNLVEKAVSGDQNSISELKNKNIKYLVISLHVNQKLNNASFELVYENDGYCVYKII